MIPKVYLIIAFLVLGDVLTTHISRIVFGEYFGELGLIANLLMRMLGESWAIAMFPIEFAIFSMTAFLFAKRNNLVRVTPSKKIPLAYLPAIALGLLVANNLVQLLIFTTSAS